MSRSDGRGGCFVTMSTPSIRGWLLAVSAATVVALALPNVRQRLQSFWHYAITDQDCCGEEPREDALPHLVTYGTPVQLEAFLSASRPSLGGGQGEAMMARAAVATMGAAEKVRILLAYGARQTTGMALCTAVSARRTDAEVLRALLSAGGPAGLPNRSRLLALRTAVLNGRAGPVRILLEHGVDPASGDASERRAIREATDLSSDVVKAIMRARGKSR